MTHFVSQPYLSLIPAKHWIIRPPLIRSIEVLGEAAKDVYRYFDEDVNKIITYLGWEQEYFLVDEDLYSARPDLSLTERTLLGHESAKNQQLDDHYFGAIPSRVQEFMKDLETECYKLGIPVKTRHNEVAPQPVRASSYLRGM